MALDNRSERRYPSERARRPTDRPTDRTLPTGRIEVRRGGCGNGGRNKNVIDCKRSISVRPHLICRRLSGSSGGGDVGGLQTVVVRAWFYDQRCYI